MSDRPDTRSILSPAVSGQNRSQRQAAGKALRETTPRSSHAVWKPSSSRSDIVEILEETNRDRVPELIPIRYARMLQSPLAALRGSAAVMAADLATLPATGIRLQSCGDCHLQNFGWFATPERNLIFDITDFDESRKAPWEWDLKRLVASVVLAARSLNLPKPVQKQFAKEVACEYRQRLTEYEKCSPLEMWYQRLDANELMTHQTEIASRQRSQAIIDAARQRTMDDKQVSKISEQVDGNWRFKDRPPLIFHPTRMEEFFGDVPALVEHYRHTLSDERRVLLDRYRLVDIAAKIVGVGSVGLRCGILLMMDDDASPLVLQFKEARASVLEKYVGPSDRPHHGHRIVHAQRVMQAASDLFLGWASDSQGRSYYFRQLRDMKMSANVEAMQHEEFGEYVQMCGWGLARAHAKSGDVSAIVGYLGESDSFDEAIAEFGLAYATQAEEDYEALKKAERSGQIPVADPLSAETSRYENQNP